MTEDKSTKNVNLAFTFATGVAAGTILFTENLTTTLFEFLTAFLVALLTNIAIGNLKEKLLKK